MWIRFERGVGGFPSRARSLMRRPWTLLAEYSGTTWSKSPSNCEKAARSRSKVTTLSTESSMIRTGLRYHFRQTPTSHSRGWENTFRSKRWTDTSWFEEDTRSRNSAKRIPEGDACSSQSPTAEHPQRTNQGSRNGQSCSH